MQRVFGESTASADRPITRGVSLKVTMDHCAQPHHRAGAAARFFAQLFGLDLRLQRELSGSSSVSIRPRAPDTCSSCGLHAWYAPLHRCSHRRSALKHASVCTRMR